MSIKNIHKLTFIFLFLFVSVAAIINSQYEVTAGGFPNRISAFVGVHVDNQALFRGSGENTQYDRLKMGAENLRGLTILIFAISTILDIKPNIILLIPFGVLLTSIGYYLLFRFFFNSDIMGFLGVLYILPYTLSSGDQLGGYVAAWTYMLFALVIVFSFRLFHSPSQNRTKKYAILIIIFYSALHLFWHTMEAQALSFMISLLIVSLIYRSFLGMGEHNSVHRIVIVLFMITIFFKDLLWRSTGGYFANISFGEMAMMYVAWIYSILDRIGLINHTTTSYEWYHYSSTNEFASVSTYSNLLLVIIIIIPILIYITKTIGDRNVPREPSTIIYTLCLAEAIMMVAYGLAGGAGFRLLRFFFPIATLLSVAYLLRNFTNVNNVAIIKKTIYVIFILMVVLNAGTELSGISDNTQSDSIKFDQLDNTVEWYLTFHTHNSSLTSDFNTASKMNVQASNRGTFIDYQIWDPDIYEQLKKDSYSSDGYLLIDNSNIDSPVAVDHSWIKMQPIAIFYDDIEKSNNKIYSDNNITIYK